MRRSKLTDNGPYEAITYPYAYKNHDINMSLLRLRIFNWLVIIMTWMKKIFRLSIQCWYLLNYIW